jgi:hypothetical protein
MRRVFVIVLGAYVLAALGNKVAERMGALQCGCAEECWCRRPSLSLFRWVFPWRHRTAHTFGGKAQLVHSAS